MAKKIDLEQLEKILGKDKTEEVKKALEQPKYNWAVGIETGYKGNELTLKSSKVNGGKLVVFGGKKENPVPLFKGSVAINGKDYILTINGHKIKASLPNDY